MSDNKRETALLSKLAEEDGHMIGKEFIRAVIMKTLHVHDAGTLRSWFNWLLAVRKIEPAGAYDVFKVVGAQPLKGDENEQVA